jgi:hypothetical protein
MAIRLVAHVAHVAYTAAVFSRFIEAPDWISEVRRAAIILFVAAHEPASGPLQTSSPRRLMSAFGGKADMLLASQNVRG